MGLIDRIRGREVRRCGACGRPYYTKRKVSGLDRLRICPHCGELLIRLN